jgi:hypothetical protein
MPDKIISYYNETWQADAEATGQLVIEIGCNDMVCLVKGAVSQEIEGFEIFRLDKESGDWTDVFYELRASSRLLNRTYLTTHCYYNFEEAIIIPGAHFTATAAGDYLSLMYGDSGHHDFMYEMIGENEQLVNAYRISRSINEMVGRHFVLYKPHHSYTSLVKDVLERTDPSDHFIKVQFYSHHIIAAVVKQNQLQLIQSFHYKTPEDILYHLVQINRQFELNPAYSHLEVSGMFETGSELHIQLQSLYGLITLDSMKPDGVFTGQYPAHYFTPFYKLVV